MSTIADINRVLMLTYYGDRCCTSIRLCGIRREVVIEFDELTTLKNGDGPWHKRVLRDMPKGSIVFCGVTRFTIPNGTPLPNDEIASIMVASSRDTSTQHVPEAVFVFEVVAMSVDSAAVSSEVPLVIEAASICVRDAEGNVVLE